MIKTAARCKPLKTRNSINTVKPRVNHFLSITWPFPCLSNKYHIYSDSDLIFSLRKCANTADGCIFFFYSAFNMYSHSNYIQWACCHHRFDNFLHSMDSLSKSVFVCSRTRIFVCCIQPCKQYTQTIRTLLPDCSTFTT